MNGGSPPSFIPEATRMARLQWDRVLETSRKRGGVALLVAGSPLLLRDPSGLRAGLVPPLDDAVIGEMLDEIRPQPAEVRILEELSAFFYGDTALQDHGRALSI
jgi:hypothetical protein